MSTFPGERHPDRSEPIDRADAHREQLQLEQVEAEALYRDAAGARPYSEAEIERMIRVTTRGEAALRAIEAFPLPGIPGDPRWTEKVVKWWNETARPCLVVGSGPGKAGS